MKRISSQMNNNNTQYNLRIQEQRLNKINNQIGTQQKITTLRDDPLAAGHLVKYQSYLTRVENYQKNGLTLSDSFVYQEGYMTNSLELMQRVRELAVTGANGVYSKDDMKNMAVEVDELLQELVQNANALDPNGKSIFSGTASSSKSFEVDLGHVDGAIQPLICEVRYNGNIEENLVEVDENKFVSVDNSGSKVFWAENMRVFGGRDLSDWQVKTPSTVNIDGVKINLETGDTIYSFVQKINNSGAAVKAGLDPITNGLNLTTTDAHQLWIEDVEGNVFNEIGMIKDSSQKPPYNYQDNVRVTGSSLFDTVISLRDSLLKGDNESIGGRVLAGIDSGISNLTTRIAKSGSNYERLQNDILRNGATALNVTSNISREGDLDITQAITDQKMLEYTQQATLSNAGKMYSSSLLNYMK